MENSKFILKGVKKYPYSRVSFGLCIICQKTFCCEGSYAKRLCSKICESVCFSNRRKGVSNKKKHYKKKPIKLKITKTSKEKLIYSLKCEVCSNDFAHTHKKLTCSKECHYQYLSTCTGHSKKFSYIDRLGRTTKLGSSWELRLAIWLDENGFFWERPKSILWTDNSGKIRNYFPDFYLPDYDVYLDPKNPRRIIEDQEKLNIVCKNITLFYGNVKDIKNKIMVLAEGAAPSRLE